MSLRVTLMNWFTLNRRVKRLEKLVQKIGQDNIAVMTLPFLPAEEDAPSGDFISGSEVEEELAEEAGDTVEEREYFEEQKRLNRQQRKDRLV